MYKQDLTIEDYKERLGYANNALMMLSRDINQDRYQIGMINGVEFVISLIEGRDADFIPIDISKLK